jgi:AcrR family transcriptional regulator
MEKDGLTTRRRPYRMVARAEATAATRDRVLDAAVETFWDTPTTDIGLEEVARRAGVTTRTVLRHFGTKDGLFEAASERESRRIILQRDTAPVGDVPGAVTVLVEHYEELGDRVLKLLAEEAQLPSLAVVTDAGRASHRAWCERVFADALAGLRGVDRERRLAQLVAVCDVYTWKLLRRDAGLTRRQTELALVELLRPLAEVSR